MMYPVEAALSEWCHGLCYLALEPWNWRLWVPAAHSFGVGSSVALSSSADTVFPSLAVQIEDFPAVLGILAETMRLDARWVGL